MSVFVTIGSTQEDGKPGLRSFEADLARTIARLSPIEAFWKYKQPFLESRGYLLRPRYHRLWKPSWQIFGGYLIEPGTEDAVILPVRSRNYSLQ